MKSNMNAIISFINKIKRICFIQSQQKIHRQMNHLTIRHYEAISHQLSEQTLASHPNQIGRILYFTLPYLIAVIINIVLFNKGLKVHQNNFVRTFPSSPYVILVFIIVIVGVGVAGVHAVLDDAWTVKQWILFAILAIFIGLKPLILTVDTSSTLLIATGIYMIAAVSNQWFFVLLRDMPQGSQSELGWKHFTRNIVGFIQAVLIIYSFEHITQNLVHTFAISQKSAILFFWIAAPIVTILVLVWNILAFGPFLDQIGYICAALLLFLGAAVSTLFHKVVDYRQSRQVSPRK